MSRNCRSFTCTNTDLLKHLSDCFHCRSYSCCVHVQVNYGSVYCLHKICEELTAPGAVPFAVAPGLGMPALP